MMALVLNKLTVTEIILYTICIYLILYIKIRPCLDKQLHRSLVTVTSSKYEGGVSILQQ